MKKEISKVYNPQEVEDKIYKKWEESGKFNPDNLSLPENKKGDKKNNFSISMPPPNATGVLHLGHASMLAYQDLMIRYNRMKEKRTLWLPGTDHASIATQTKVEKIIAEEGKTKYNLGREKFLERVNEYVENSKNTIKNQTRKMGSSCDWSRERYTLDDGLSRAVKEVFVKMYNDELIYRGDRIVNWCPRCESTLADDEVEHKDQKANLYYFKYDKDFPITIATTRPETKLGDTAVAVNPKDERYKKYIGKVYKIDLGNGEHKIKIIADREVDIEFGTGALGVTPAHSMTDWEMAEKNDLEKIKIIGEDGKMNTNAGKDYAGLTVLKAREKFVKYLENNNLIEKVEEVDQSLSVCYRCGAPIEPLPSLQWFVSVDKKITIEGNKYFQNKSLKEVSLEVVKNKEIEIIPKRFEKTYFHWMENLRDWCISRQIWFGHRIPVWYKNESGIRNQESGAKGPKDKQQIYVGTEPPKENSNYKLAHVFGSDKNSGNLAGIITEEIEENEMPKIAKEIGAPESVFISKSKDSNYDADFRFFSKTGEETPLCGHALLAGAVTVNKTEQKIKTKAGDVLIKKFGNKIFFQANNPVKIEPNFFERLPFECFGISEDDCELLGISSIGTAKLILKVRDTETLKKVNPNFENLKKWNKDKNFSGYCLFAKDKENKEKVFVRQFNPFLGVNEDEATAVAAGALAFFISYDFIVKQGTKNFENEIIVKHNNDNILVGGNVFLRNDNWVQDSDTLDTWFSSGLWTFSTLLNKNHEKYKTFEEWVANSPDLKNFHPTSVMETGYDILFFWVARMILMTTYTMGEIPFEKVYLHGMVCDKQGKKMSKSLGNGIDPIEMIEKYGTDALRLSMIIGSSPGNDIKMYEEKIEGYRNFVNKLWNVFRYIWDYFYDVDYYANIQNQENKNWTLADHWILSRMSWLRVEVTKCLNSYNFSRAGELLYDFTWNEFADWYVEISKIEKHKEKNAVFSSVMDDLLKLWHPFMPFVTEKIWSIRCSKNKDNNKFLMIEKWPMSDVYGSLWNRKREKEFNLIKDIIIAIRSLRAEYKIEPSKKIDAVIYAGNKKELIEAQAHLIKNLRTGIDKLEIKEKGDKIKNAAYLVVGDIEIYLIGMIDKEKEKNNLEKEIDELEKYIKQIKNKLENEQFVKNAPADIVEKERVKYKEGSEKIGKLEEKLKSFSA